MDIYYVKAAACISAAIAVGIGVVGPALGQGMIGSKACENIGKYPESSSKIRQVMIVSMSMVETSSIWCVLVAGALIVIAFYAK